MRLKLGIPLLGVVVAATFVPGVPAQAAATHAQISGSGSSWASNLVNQWVADVFADYPVVFTSTGSAQGRADFTNRVSDFGVTDLPYGLPDTQQGPDSPCQDPTDPATCRDLVYAPLVAGGTAFPYHLMVAGKLVTNLRLSGPTIAGIFTNRITSWNDPEIRQENPDIALPATPIIPVVHAEGAGSTWQFTSYLDAVVPSVWRPFGGTGPTKYFPQQGAAVAQNGSDGVINFIASAAANGSIGYDETTYARVKGLPTVKVLNAGGYYVAPTAPAVSVALSAAVSNPDGTLDLSGVYSSTDPRAYPISSSAYLLIPTSATDPRMNTAKRQTLADFLYRGVCRGQKEADPLGYAPLPITLVTSALTGMAELQSADPAVDLSASTLAGCDNPTITDGASNLSTTAPAPPACDSVQSTQQCGYVPPLKRTGLGISVTPRSASRLHAYRETVSGVLAVGRTGVASQEVTLQVRRQGLVRWTTVSTRLTSRSGRCTFTVRQRYAAEQYRLVFVHRGLLAASSSHVVTIRRV